MVSLKQEMLRKERNPCQRPAGEVGTSPTLVGRVIISEIGRRTRIVPFRTVFPNYLVFRYSYVASDVGDLGAPKFRGFLKLVSSSFRTSLIANLSRREHTCVYGSAIIVLPRNSDFLRMRTIRAVITRISIAGAKLRLFARVHFYVGRYIIIAFGCQAKQPFQLRRPTIST